MKKRIFAMLLSLTMIMAMFPATAMAEEVIDWTDVGTVEEMKNALAEKKTHIRLTANLDFGTDKPLITSNVTIDLNGHEIMRTHTNFRAAAILVDGAPYEVEISNGTITEAGAGMAVYAGAGSKVTLNGVVLNGAELALYATGTNTELTLNNCYATVAVKDSPSEAGDGIRAYYGATVNVNTVADGTENQKSGATSQIVADFTAIECYGANTTVNVGEGTLLSGRYAFTIWGGTVNTAGNISGSENCIGITHEYDKDEPEQCADRIVNITAGTVEGSFVASEECSSDAYAETISITGGSFEIDPDCAELQATGYSSVKNKETGLFDVDTGINLANRFLDNFESAVNHTWNQVQGAAFYYGVAQKYAELHPEVAEDMATLTERINSVETVNLANAQFPAYIVNKDLGALEFFPGLKNVNVSGVEGITNFGALAKLSNLETLNISNTSAADFNFVWDDSSVDDETSPVLPNLKSVTAQGLTLTSIDGLAEIAEQEDFDATGYNWDLSGSTLTPNGDPVNSQNMAIIAEAFAGNDGWKAPTYKKAVGSVVAPVAKTGLFANGKAQELIVAGSSETGTIVYALGENGEYSNVIPTASAVGTYQVYYKVLGDIYHEDIAPAYVEVTIAKKDVSRVTLNQSALELVIGQSETLSAAVTPEDATDQNVTWTSNNPEIADVDTTGKVTAVAAGTAIITATADGKTATCTVTVEAPKSGDNSIVSLKVNGEPVAADEQDSTSYYTTVPYTTDKVTIVVTAAASATVTGAGEKTLIAGEDNTFEIVVTAENGTRKTYTVVVARAADPTVAVESVTLNKTALTLELGQSEVLIATVTPDNATDKTVQWFSDNCSIAAVDTTGKVTAEAVGATTITAVAGTKTVTCTVTVTAPAPIYPEYPSVPSTPSAPTTTVNPDGSTTTTQVDKITGTVTETTKNTDGSTEIVKTEKDGTVTTNVAAANGSKSETVVKNGVQTSEVTVSNKAVTDAAKAGEAVALPMPEVTASQNSVAAPTVTVDLPYGVNSAKVEIPVENVTAGVVAVIVHADGTEEVVRTCVPTEDGIALNVENGATVKLVDNSRDFGDVADTHTFNDAVDFASARGIVEGYSNGNFGVGGYATSAATATVIARIMGEDFYGSGSTAKAQDWAKENGIAAGLDLSGNVSRGDFMTMLWRAAGCPAASAADLDFTDTSKLSAEEAAAIAWAVANGVIGGYSDGTVRPDANITRGAMAAIAQRYMMAQ